MRRGGRGVAGGVAGKVEGAMNKLPELVDDGLETPVVGPQSEEKYRHIAYYVELFAKSMHKKWGSRIYIDLFAGSGRSKIKGTSKIVAGSPMLAIQVEHQFDKYIFCDIDEGNISALQKRAEAQSPSLNADYYCGDVNLRVADIVSAIPTATKDHTVLTFCLVDPFKAKDLHFGTLRRISARYVDFLVLIPSYMEINRFPEKYCRPSDQRLDRFLGTTTWRQEWVALGRSGHFGAFIAGCFDSQMVGLGFCSNKDKFVLIKGADGNNLYHLAFYSKSPLGVKFWDKVRLGVSGQADLF